MSITKTTNQISSKMEKKFLVVVWGGGGGGKSHSHHASIGQSSNILYAYFQKAWRKPLNPIKQDFHGVVLS